MLKNPLFFILFLFIIPSTGYTLGFGDITVFSKLNEPLKAQVNITDSKSVLLDELVVKNADIKTYRRANLPRPDAFNRARFKTKKLNNGLVVVEITTRKPVREPFITFIADLKWLSGHLNREYTFLLDPPEFVQKQMYKSKSKAKKASKQKASKKASKARPPRQTTHRKIDYSAVIKNHVDGDTYTIKRADTLWNIAKKVKPGNGVSTYQTMQALYALNPQAFINNNINLIKEGQTLKIPTENEIRHINGKAPLKKPRQTSSSLTKQAKSKTAKVEKAPQPIKSPKPEKTIPQAMVPEDKAQLKIIPPAEVILNTPVTSKEDLTTINRALKNSITTIKTLSYENEALNEEILKLTKKLEQLDSHNKGLNEKLSSIVDPVAQPADSTLAQQANTSSVVSTAKSSTTAPETIKDTLSKQETNSLEIDSPLATMSKPQSFIKKLSTNPIFIIALAIIIVLMLIALFIIIRSQRDDNKRNKYQAVPERNNTFKESSLASDNSTAANNNTRHSNDNSPSSLQGTDISNEKDEEDMDFFEYFEKKINQADSEADNKNGQSSQTLQESEGKKAQEVEEEKEISFNLDIAADEIEAYEKSITEPKVTVSTTLSEIDTYLAYGNYDEAEKRLLSELKNNPSDKKLHLKLFECYTFSNKRFEFIQHAEKNINILNNDMVLRHRIESIFQQSWNEPLVINK